MRFNLFKIVLLAIALMFVFPEETKAQNDEMFKGKRKYKHRRRGRREQKNKTAYNPFIDPDTQKSKKLATKEMQKEEKKVFKRSKKAIRKEKRKLRRTKGAYKK